MEPIDYLRVLRRRWVVVATTVLVAVSAAWIWTAVQHPVAQRPSFEATAVLLKTGSTSGGSSIPGSISNLNTIAALVPLQPIPDRVARDLGSKSSQELADEVQASVDSTSYLLKITATAPNPQKASLVAGTFAKELIASLIERQQNAIQAAVASSRAQLARAQQKLLALAGAGRQGTAIYAAVATRLADIKLQIQQLLQFVPDPGVQTVQTTPPVPVVASTITAPRSLKARGFLGLVIGLLCGAGLALVLERVDMRLRTKEQTEEAFRLPVLAEIPRNHRKGVVSASDSRSLSSESYRLLGAEVTRLVGVRGTKPRREGNPSQRTILVTSAGPGEGKSTVVANLAVTLAAAGSTVIVISCDLRRPSIHTMLGVTNSPGLAEALRSAGDGPVLDRATRSTPFPRVRVVPSEVSEDAPGDLLSGNNMRRVLKEARASADFVLLDTAPMLVVSDVFYLLNEVDAVLLVARAGKTSNEVAGRTTELLSRFGAAIVGVALNAASEIAIPHDYRSYYLSAREKKDLVGDGREREVAPTEAADGSNGKVGGFPPVARPLAKE